jgi:hypothetical protein
MNANRRLRERKQPERALFCDFGGEENGLVLDLSEDGLRFESVTPIEEKDSLQLRLSVDANSAIEATGKLAWIDSAKRTGGLRFLDLSAPAREQIRTWLSEASPASGEANSRASLRKHDKQADDGAATEKQAILAKTHVPSLQLPPVERQREEISALSMQLVPVEQYRKQTRLQFLRGALVGFGICFVLMIPIFRYAGGAKPGSPAPTAASTNHTPQLSGEQTRASVAQPSSPIASISKPPAAKPLAMQRAAAQTVFAAAPTGPRQQRPLTAGASSTDLMTRTSSPQAKPQPAKPEEPLGASPVAVATAPAASKVNSSSGQMQQPKKVSATPQQLWSALQAGNINAAVALADLYARGEGVPVNCQQARVLLLAASAKNIPEASKKLQALNKGGCPAHRE